MVNAPDGSVTHDMGSDVEAATQCRSGGAGNSHFGFRGDLIRLWRGRKALKNRLAGTLRPVHEMHFNRETRFPEGGTL